MNKKTVLPILTILIVIAIIAFLGFENVFVTIGFICCSILFLGILVPFGIYDLVKKTKKSILPAGIFLSFIIVLISQLAIRDYLNDKKKAKAEKLIEKIEKFRLDHGMYPERKEIIQQGDSDLFYYKNNRGNDYTITFLIDGWHTITYLSNEKRWSQED